jgi:hypothetical protein
MYINCAALLRSALEPPLKGYSFGSKAEQRSGTHHATNERTRLFPAGFIYNFDRETDRRDILPPSGQLKIHPPLQYLTQTNANAAESMFLHNYGIIKFPID